MTQRINAAGLSLIKRFEGLRLDAYKDAVGVWTIGYGHTRHVHEGDTCSEAEAERYLREDLQEAEFAVESLIIVDLNANQFSALCSFVFNLGETNFAKSSLRKLINAGALEAAAGEFHKWNHANGETLPGLTRRRQAEEELFRKPVRSLGSSRTIRAGTVATVSAPMSGVMESLSDAQDTLGGLAPYMKTAAVLLLCVTMISVGMMVWARIDDHAKGRR